MSQPGFELVSFGEKRFAINDRGRTVALISKQGNVDWLLRSPMEKGELITRIVKDTHNCYTMGVKLHLVPPHIDPVGVDMGRLNHKVEDGGRRIVLTADTQSRDGQFVSHVVAELYVDALGARYEWRFNTQVTCLAREPQKIHSIEFNNVYPGTAGRCMLFEPQKQYRWTLMTDRDGVVWRFPHQHELHYGPKISQVGFADGTLSGFFGEPTGSPVVIVDHSDLEPTWGICDMFYDLHCMALLDGPMAPGRTVSYVHRVKYLSAAESDKLVQASRPVPITDADRTEHQCPRFALGLNRFTEAPRIDGEDDASAFKPRPPVMVWDREAGHSAKGSLRLTNEQPRQTIWPALPPSQIPSEHVLNIRAMVSTQNVTGTGACLRVRYHTWVIEPDPPHVEFVRELRSTPVTGTTPGWVKVEVPPLEVPKEHLDYLVYIDVVLDGQGVAWVTDVDVDLQPARREVPALERDTSGSVGKSVAVGAGSVAGGTAT